jgi:hypothetical protein
MMLAACGGGAAREEPAPAETTGAEAGASAGSTAGPTAGPDQGPTGEGARATSAGSEASADLQSYATAVLAAVRRHWSIPPTLSPAEAAILESSIEIRIDEATRQPTGFTVRTPSGNAIFDGSVQRALQALVDAGQPMPAPPVGLDDRSSVRLRLRGRR